MDVKNFELPNRFYRWGLAIAMAMMVMAFMLAVNSPVKSIQPCQDLTVRSQAAQVESNIP